MVTAKIGGSSRPWTKRQKMTWFSVGASAVMVAGMSSSAIAATIRRFLPDHVGQRAGERRGRRDRERAGGDDQAGVGGADAVLARHHRQHGLRRVEVQERADGAEGDGDAARVGEHGRHSAQFC